MAAAALFIPSAAGAQMLGRDVPHAGTFEVSAGVQSTGSYDFGSSLADETRNPTTGPDPLTLFQGDSSFGRGNGFFARVGIFLRPRIEVEGGVQATRPSLIVRTSGDFESAPDTTIESPLTEYVVDGSLLYHFGRGAFVPFAFGGGGYLRQVLEDASIVETGSEFHGGAGVKYWFGHARRLGIRAEGRASSRSGGVSLDGSSKRRFAPTFSAGAAYLF
jgi:hypothetical protein